MNSKGLHALWRRLINIALPGVCQLCSARADGMLCQACERDFPAHRPPSCAICDVPLTGGDVCADCLRSPPSFDRALAGLRFEAPVNSLIHQLKHAHGCHWVASLCAPLLARVRETYGEALPGHIVAVPIHWRRRIWRGYNQSALLASHLSRELTIPCANWIKKRHRTTPQRELKREQRLQNLRGSFVCQKRLNGGHIAVVDDVLTTGATAECVAHALKDAGADRVDIWSVARTPKPLGDW